jgi:nucleoside-diphosphate-sugar epimerase
MILITGSTGYIGSHISEFFEQKKINYIGIDNLSYSYKSNVQIKKNTLK